MPTAAASKREHARLRHNPAWFPPHLPQHLLWPCHQRLADGSRPRGFRSTGQPGWPNRHRLVHQHQWAPRSGKSDPRSGVMTTWHGMEMSLSGSVLARPGHREWGQNQPASPPPAADPSTQAHSGAMQPERGFSGVRGGEVAALTRRITVQSAAPRVREDNGARPEPDALVSRGGHWSLNPARVVLGGRWPVGRHGPGWRGYGASGQGHVMPKTRLGRDSGLTYGNLHSLS